MALDHRHAIPTEGDQEAFAQALIEEPASRGGDLRGSRALLTARLLELQSVRSDYSGPSILGELLRLRIDDQSLTGAARTLDRVLSEVGRE
jgi:hypothetical protein